MFHVCVCAGTLQHIAYLHSVVKFTDFDTFSVITSDETKPIHSIKVHYMCCLFSETFQFLANHP